MTSRPTTCPAARRVVIAALLLLPGCSLHEPGLGPTFLAPLPVVDAATEREGMVTRFGLPAVDPPVLVRIGPPPTPLSLLPTCETDRALLIPLYESLSDLRLLVVDKATGTTRELVLPGAQLTYHPLRDVRDPASAWVPGCLGAVLFRYDGARGAVEKVLEVPGESHLFGLDQQTDGTLYLGTYPNVRCLRVRPGRTRPVVEEIEVETPAVAGCRYVRDVFAADDALFLHYMSPGVLVRHELHSGRSMVLMRTDAPKLQFRATPEGLKVWSETETLHFDRRGRRVDQLQVASPTHRVTQDGPRATATWDTGTAPVSLLPRDRGMRITCFEGTRAGWICGASYWNTWMFRLDPDASTLAGLGAIPSTAAEFFTIGEQGGAIFIPQYQGDLLVYDPSRPWTDDPAAPNPRLDLRLADAHFGLSCVTDAGGRLVCATAPNFHQRGGMLIVRSPGGTYDVFDRIGDDLTLDHLVSRGGDLFAGTVERTGMGLRRDPATPLRPPAVVRLSADTGAILDQVALDAPAGDDVKGLVEVSATALLCATSRRLHVVETGARPMTAARITGYDALARGPAGSTTALASYGPDLVLILSRNLLTAYAPSTGRLRVLSRLPVSMDFMVVGKDGALWLAGGGTVYCLPRSTMTRLLDVADVAGGRRSS